MVSASVIAAVDAGSATIAASLLGRVAGRWRLLATGAAPAGASEAALLYRLMSEVRSGDHDLAASLGLAWDGDSLQGLTVLRARTSRPPTLAVLAGSPRALTVAEGLTAGAGWRTVGAQPEASDPREVTGMLLRPEVEAVLLAAEDPPGADERASIDDLTALAAAARVRRPALPVVLAGAMATRERRFDRLGLDDDVVPGNVPGPVISVPVTRGTDLRARVRGVLANLRAPDGDGRTAIAHGAAALAAALDRRVEVLDIGFDAGSRTIASPPLGEDPGSTSTWISADAALVPPDPGDSATERFLAWSSRWADRHEISDRLHDLRLSPWAEAGGLGPRIRLVAAGAALERLISESGGLDGGPPPDLIVLRGGGFALAPAAAVTVTVADVLRRPGAVQMSMDHARLLAALGSDPDEARRGELVRDLAGDLLLPLGSLLVLEPSHRPNSPPIHVNVAIDGADLALDVAGGTIELVDLPPGAEAATTIELPPTGLRRTARRSVFEVSGGLAGLVVDARGVPLRLPASGEERRSVLGTWHDPLWSPA
jgi:hypothetical protein